MLILCVHTVTIKLQMFKTNCVKTCLTALMEYSENTESHSDSQILNMITFWRLICSHSIGSRTVTLFSNDRLVFPLFSAAHFGPPYLPPLWYCKVTCRHRYRTTTMAPRWRTATFPYRGPWPTQCSVSWQKDWKCGTYCMASLGFSIWRFLKDVVCVPPMPAAAVQPRGGKQSRPGCAAANMRITIVGTSGG
jgi:hypothetical protein